MNIPGTAQTWNATDDALGAPASLPASFEEASLADQEARAHRRAVNPPLAILGVPFDNVTTEQAIRAIAEMVESRRPHYLVTANVDFLVQAQSDVELRRILFDANLVLCDGTPLLWASRLLGNPLAERVAGADIVPLLVQLAAKRKYRIFLLGASPESAQRAVANLRRQYENLIIAGHYSPPFCKLLEMDHEEIKRRILAAQPDMLFVSFGCPKQEKWISMHYRALGVPVAAGVGATIDFLAGDMKRAPGWMQRCGIEWVFRLAQEPRRLFGRYMKDIWVFGGSILRQWWHMQFHTRTVFLPLTERADQSSKNRLSEEVMGSSAAVASEENRVSNNTGQPPYDRAPVTNNFNRFQWHTLPERLDLIATREGVLPTEEILHDGRDCMLQMTNVQFIDSTGVGQLIQLQKKLRAIDRQLVLVAVCPAVQQALKLMRLEEFFAIAPDQASAESLLTSRGMETMAGAALHLPTPAQPLTWQGEITAANAESVWNLARAHLTNAAEGSQPEVIIDLSSVRFMDSSGLGVMVRIKKLAQHHGTRLVFRHVQPAVQNVIHLSRMQEFLLGRTGTRR